MYTPAGSLKRLALSLTLALTAVVVLTAWLDYARAQGGALVVVGTGPAANAVSVDPSTAITMTFSHPMSPTTITSRTFRVHGSMSGRLDGALGYDVSARTATFDPAQDLKPGEWIAAGLTTGTQDITGTTLAAPYAWSFVAQASRGGGHFVPANPPHYSVDQSPSSIYGADLDGDGDVDLVTASWSEDTVSVLLNDGRGIFSPTIPRDYAVDHYPNAIAGADLDGDGDIDLVTTNHSGDTVSVLLNDGDGTLSSAMPRDYAVDDSPQSVCLSDLDGDGDPDLATANWAGETVSVLSNNGDGTFNSFTPRDHAVADGPRDIFCADLEGDGDVDLVTSNELSDNVSLLLNSGDGSFTPASPRHYRVGDGPRSVWGADLDNDGDADLVTANQWDDDVSILMNDGLGHFISTVDDVAVHDQPRSIRSADLDGDGDLDLVTANASSDDVSVVLNVGDGTFAPASPRDYRVGNTPLSVYVADLDGDADLDLVVADYSSDQVSVLSNFGLKIEKSALTPEQWPGWPVTYTLRYTNFDAGTLRGVIITDQLPISLTNAHYTFNGPVITPTTDLTYAWQVAPLPSGAGGVITVSAILSPDLSTDSVFDNHATIAHSRERLTDVATVSVNGASKLWINKTVESLPYVILGDRFTYTIQVTASGAPTISGWLTDHLPEGTHFVAATSGFTPTSPTAGTPIAWTLPAGVYRPPVTFRYTVVLTADGPSRPLSNLAQAVYPGVVTATDQVGIWVWSDVAPDNCQRDAVILFDRSGSMQESTRCYGCWQGMGEYPEGDVFPLPFEDPGTGVVVHCEPSDPVNYQGYWYISVEAEHYSHYLLEADYHWDRTGYPKTWWAMQRQPNKRASGPDDRGAWMMVGPNSPGVFYYSSLNDIRHPPDPNATPRLDYEFTVPQDGTYWVWMRAQGGVSSNSSIWADGRDSRRRVHVGLDGTPMATGSTSEWGSYNDGANANNWRWSRVLELQNLVAHDVVTTVTGTITVPHVYTLSFWQAGQGFRLDKIVVTNDPRTNLMDGGRPLDWDRPGVPDAGPAETHGRTGWACDPIDPRFTPTYTNAQGELIYDGLYDDHQPIRFAKEASKSFVRQLHPVLDQAGYVWYGEDASIRSELYCQVNPGFCEDFESVVEQIEVAQSLGNTNIADALWDGLRVLTAGQEPPNDGGGLPSKEPGRSHYGRTQTYGTLILITDGWANQYPNLPSGYGNCYSHNLWPNEPGESIQQRRAKECAVWFALHARDQGVAIHTIGLGARADHELLLHIANLTGGSYFFAAEASELEDLLAFIESETRADCLSSGVDVTKRVTPETSVIIGERLTYTLQTTLSGWIRPTLWLTDHLPPDTEFILATPGYASNSGESLVWSLPYGVFTKSLTLTHIIVLNATGPAGLLTNTVVADDLRLRTTTDSAVLTVSPTFAPSADLIVSQVSHGPDRPVAGQAVHFTVTVQNQGPTAVPGWLAVELYAKSSAFSPAGPPTGPGDHAGGWCADPPACDQTRSGYLGFFHGLAPGESRTLHYSIVLDEADDYQVYAQVDVDRVGGATQEYGAVLESDEGNNVLSYGTMTVGEPKEWRLYLPILVKGWP